MFGSEVSVFAPVVRVDNKHARARGGNRKLASVRRKIGGKRVALNEYLFFKRAGSGVENPDIMRLRDGAVIGVLQRLRASVKAAGDQMFAVFREGEAVMHRCAVVDPDGRF